MIEHEGIRSGIAASHVRRGPPLMISSAPIFARELLVAARQAGFFRTRVVAVALMFGVLGLCFRGMWVGPGGEMSTSMVTRFAAMTFGFLVILQAVLTLILVPQPVARGVAGLRERRVLADLLTTRLTSAEIVLGTVAAALVRLVALLAIGLPVTTLLVFLGGVDPALVLLAYGGLGSLGFVVASLAAFIAVGRRTRREALGTTVALGAAWVTLPMPLTVVLPFAWVPLRRVLQPVVAWLLWSSPMNLVWTLGRAGVSMALVEAWAWMVGLQFAAGAVFLVLAVAALRPASRALEGGGRVLLPGRRRADGIPWRWRIWPKPQCGEDPVLWKEMYTERINGWTKIANVLAYVGLVSFIGYGVYLLGWPALRETLANGYSSTVNGDRRDFNQFLRIVTAIVTMVIVMVVTGASGESVALEKTRDTWISLLATPLTGREILRAKALGAIWRVRWGMALVAVLGALGVAAGAVHPLGYLASLVVLIAFVGFHAALGMALAMRASESKSASSWVALIALALTFSPMVYLLPLPTKSVFLAAGSAPYLEALTLVSWSNIDEIVRGHNSSDPSLLGMRHEEPMRRVALACLAGAAAACLGASLLSRAAFRRFDRAVDRPARPNAAVQGGSARVPEEPGVLVA
jgi:ABC-type Na+ efflux pump permease subunit